MCVCDYNILQGMFMYMKFVQLETICCVKKFFPFQDLFLLRHPLWAIPGTVFIDNLPAYKLNTIFLSYRRVIYNIYGSMPFFA